MKGSKHRIARTQNASGRFLFPRPLRVGVLLLVGVFLLGACAVAGPAPGARTPADVAPADPVIEQGPISRAREAEAARMLREASDAYEAGNAGEAARLSHAVVERFPTAPVSGRALLLNARSSLAAGDSSASVEAAEQYIGLLQTDDPRAADVRILQAEALAGDPEAALDRLLRMRPAADDAVLERGFVLARSALEGLDRETVATVVARSPGDGPIAPVVQVAYARLLFLAGEDEAAARFARRALESGARLSDRTLAQALARGELPGEVRVTTVNIATVLPLSGSPAMADFARRVAEGVAVAAASALGDRFEVQVNAQDDQGDVGQTASLVGALGGTPVVGAIGFLEDNALEAAAGVRPPGVPIVSPTARSAARAGDGVYSLSGPDPQAAILMARYAADQGFTRVAIVHSQVPQSSEEADAFEAEAIALGIPVAGRFAYAPGATFFEPQVTSARNSLRAAEIRALRLGPEDTLFVDMLEPVGLFMPLPTEDVELVAPQVTHFGLDTLGIHMLGTSGWTDAQTLAAIDTRHTNGVVATAPVGAGLGSDGQRRFRAAYEAYFRRSLVGPVPAVGYDAALLLLEAIRRSGGRNVGAAFEALQDVEGATGTFSVVRGRIVRRTEVVSILSGTLTPIPMTGR